MEFDLTLVGCGLRSLDHLTRESDRCLRAARVVFHSIYSRDLLADLHALNPRARFVPQEEGEYVVGQFRPDMYERIAAKVLDEAAREPGVVVLHPGSAMVVDAIARRLLSRCAELGLRARVLPGISSVEFVLAELGWDLACGLQVILAQNLVLHRRRLDPGQAAIVIQPGYYDTLWFAGAPLSLPGRFDALQARLALSYPADAPMALVLAPVGAAETGRVFWFRLGRLQDVASLLSPFHTLFIPPLAAPGANPEFERRIVAWEDLMQRVAQDEYGLPRQADPRNWFDASWHGVDENLAQESADLAAAWPGLRLTLAREVAAS